jgi:oligosaccharide repeat unit polymerase
MTFFYIACLCIVVLSAYYYGKDLFSPVRVFIGVYAFLLAVNSLHLSDFQAPWALTTSLFFWGATFCFIAGSGIILLVNRIRNPLPPLDFGGIKTFISADAGTMDWKWFFWVWLACTGIFCASYLLSYAISGTIPILSKALDSDKARTAFFSATVPTNFGLFFGPISLILGTEMLLFGSLCRRRKIAIAIISFVTVALYVTVVTRLDLFRFLLFVIVVYHYGVKRLSMAQILYVFGFSVVFFLLFSLFRIQYETLGIWAAMQKMHIPKEFIWCSNLYMYVVNNFWNFDFGVRKFVEGTAYYPHGWGFDLLRPFLYVGHLESALQSSYGFDSINNESVIMVSGLNTVIYIWHFFKDFGVFGVYFLPLLGGMLSTIFYVNTMNTPTLFRVSLWAMFVPFILLSYHAPLWELWFIYMNILFLAIAHRRIKLTTDMSGRENHAL